MTITFVLPGLSRKNPVGGFRVVYEYANRLADRGHTVNVVHPLILFPEQMTPKHRLGIPLVLLTRRISGLPRVGWFDLSPKVNLMVVRSLEERWIPQGDVIVATAWQTAEWVNGYDRDKGEKFYLIQHYEKWSGPEERVEATWKMPLKKIVIARWLQEKARELGDEAAAYIPNGMDLERFRITHPIGERNPRRIGMLYHVYDWKGSRDGIEALNMTREEFPNLEAVFFSVYHPGPEVPSWVEFCRNPSPARLVEIYNSCAIFASPSWAEGWPLPPAESMACGCALAAAGNPGVREYAIHEETALLSKPKSSKEMTANLIRLIKDQDLRVRLAEGGHRLIQNFTWDKATNKFEETVSNRHQDMPRRTDP